MGLRRVAVKVSHNTSTAPADPSSQIEVLLSPPGEGSAVARIYLRVSTEEQDRAAGGG